MEMASSMAHSTDAFLEVRIRIYGCYLSISYLRLKIMINIHTIDDHDRVI
jgi:hypothetical protein